MFAINTSLLVLAIIYSLFALDWQTSPHQKPLIGVNVFADFFDKEHVRATIKTLGKSRPNRRKLHLWVLFIAMALYTFQRDEKPMSYLYTQRMFNWDVKIFSTFRTLQSALFVFGEFVICFFKPNTKKSEICKFEGTYIPNQKLHFKNWIILHNNAEKLLTSW